MGRIVLLLAAALLVAGCGAGGDDDADYVTDPVSGRALADFEGDPTYAWRDRLRETSDDYLSGLSEIDESLGGESALQGAVDLCRDLAEGPVDAAAERGVRTHFEVRPEDAAAVLALTVRHVCPEVGD